MKKDKIYVLGKEDMKNVKGGFYEGWPCKWKVDGSDGDGNDDGDDGEQILIFIKNISPYFRIWAFLLLSYYMLYNMTNLVKINFLRLNQYINA